MKYSLDTLCHVVRSAWLGAAASILVVMVFGIAACTGGAAAGQLQVDASQRTLLPVIAGVSYDNDRERVYLSVCTRQLFDCDLAAIDAGAEHTLRYIREGGAYGYTRPAVLGDGRYLVAARNARGARANRRGLAQEIVRIDLNTGEETVIVAAGAFRYEALTALDDETIVATQTYRSSDDLHCMGDFCSDLARFVMVNAGRATTFDLTVPAPGALGNGNISVLPLGEGRAWIRASVQGEAGGRVINAWALSGAELSPPAGNTEAMQSQFTRLTRSYYTGSWRFEQLAPGGPPVELRQFAVDRATHGGVEQVTLNHNGYGARITKRRSGGAMLLAIEIVHNEGVSPWTVMRRFDATYAPSH